MRLRKRLSDELTARLALTLPQALETVWDTNQIAVVVEAVKFTPTGGGSDGWDRRAEINGVMRAELRGDDIDALTVEPLIASLVSVPVFLNLEPDTPEGSLSEKARFVLQEWRDTIRDTQVVSALRFSVEGEIAARVAPDPLPQHVTIADHRRAPE